MSMWNVVIIEYQKVPSFTLMKSREHVHFSCLSSLIWFYLQIGTHGLIIEFTDPNNNTRRSATYLPEVIAHEGKTCCLLQAR